MRTQEEIMERIESLKDVDYLGFERNTLLPFLELKNAKPYLKEDIEISESEWEDTCKEKQSPKEVMIDYMDFAWEKANNKRGISAYRTMCHYKHWLWLDGDDLIWKTLDDYNFYGKPQLIEICKYLGIDSNKWDDHIREND